MRIRTQEGFLTILLLLLLLLPDKEKQVHPFPKTGAPISINRCTYFTKQVHPFWGTDMPVKL